jgi:uncharacterized protein (DUF302 family)
MFHQEIRMRIQQFATVCFVLLATSLFGASARAAETTFTGTRVTVDSSTSYEQVVEALKSLVAKNGMMVMAEVNQGQMLSMTGLSLKATVLLVGNPTVGKQLFEQDQAVGLYVPLRVSVYADADGRTHVEYDRPSSLLGQFKNEKIAMAAKMLDEKLAGLANMAAK